MSPLFLAPLPKGRTDSLVIRIFFSCPQQNPKLFLRSRPSHPEINHAAGLAGLEYEGPLAEPDDGRVGLDRYPGAERAPSKQRDATTDLWAPCIEAMGSVRPAIALGDLEPQLRRQTGTP
jgi:hypothetical protein